MQGPYIENCFCLTPKRVDQSLSRIRKIGDKSDFQRADITYDYEEVDGKYFILASVAGNVPQRIALETLETSFGERQYFHCENCDARRHKLFLLPGGHIFRCFKCQGIRRETFNPSSKQGQLFIRAKKILKLIDQQSRMTSRIWYRSVYTKRYEKFLSECLKIGLTDIVEEARALESAIKANG